MIFFLHQLAANILVQIIIGEGIIAAALFWLGQWAFRHNYKTEAIRDLMTYRGNYSSIEFRQALNKVVIAFHKDAIVRKEVRELYETINNSPRPESIKRAIVGLIYLLCQKSRFRKVTEYDIDQSFLELSQTPQPSQPHGTPPSTPSTSSTTQQILESATEDATLSNPEAK